jgi:hypothetical protein
MFNTVISNRKNHRGLPTRMLAKAAIVRVLLSSSPLFFTSGA